MNRLSIIALLSTLCTMTDYPDVQDTFVCTIDEVNFHVTFNEDDQLLCFVYDDIDEDYSEIIEEYVNLTEDMLKEHVKEIHDVLLRVVR